VTCSTEEMNLFEKKANNILSVLSNQILVLIKSMISGEVHKKVRNTLSGGTQKKANNM
jgi:hypothetical protein